MRVVGKKRANLQAVSQFGRGSHSLSFIALSSLPFGCVGPLPVVLRHTVLAIALGIMSAPTLDVRHFLNQPEERISRHIIQEVAPRL